MMFESNGCGVTPHKPVSRVFQIQMNELQIKENLVGTLHHEFVHIRSAREGKHPHSPGVQITPGVPYDAGK